MPEEVAISGKTDTGAKMTSLSAIDLETFQRHRQKWVRFTVVDRIAKKRTKLERPLVRFTRIKQRREASDEEDAEENKRQDDIYAARPVIELELQLGQQRQKVLVNLVDRTHFVFPLLIGRDAIRAFGKVVDPSTKE